MSLPPRHPQTVPYVDESIRRRAAKSSVSFIELLEQSAGYDDDIESIASSIGRDQENVEGLEFLQSSGYLERKKARRRKRRKHRNQSRRNKKEGSKHSKLSSFDLVDAEYDGETIEVPCYAKLVVSFDAPIIAPPSNPKFLQVQTAWVETPSRPLRKIMVTSESLEGKKQGYYLPPNMGDDDDIYSDSSSSESSGDGRKNGDAGGDGNESSGSEMMSLHSDASSDGFNNDAIDVEKAFQLDKLD
eukprot:g16120.t1